MISRKRKKIAQNEFASKKNKKIKNKKRAFFVDEKFDCNVWQFVNDNFQFLISFFDKIKKIQIKFIDVKFQQIIFRNKIFRNVHIVWLMNNMREFFVLFVEYLKFVETIQFKVFVRRALLIFEIVYARFIVVKSSFASNNKLAKIKTNKIWHFLTSIAFTLIELFVFLSLFVIHRLTNNLIEISWTMIMF